MIQAARVPSDHHRTRRHSDVGRVFGSYRTLGLMGEGGMGRVFLAEHTRLGRKVALKLLKPQLARRPGMLQQFFDEARAVNRIRHPNIVDVVDFVAEGDEAYYIMEYLPGRTLSQTLRENGGPLPVDRALNIAAQVADALQAAHESGIVHLDVKPSNILVLDGEGPEDRVKLMDFGTARLMEEREDEWAERETAPLFTPVYMSPEQGRGRRVDARSDVYSLGVVLYEMLAGEPPFVAQSMAEYCYKHMREAPTRITQVRGLPHRIPRRVGSAVMRCLAKAPNERFQSMTALAAVLRNPRMDSGRFRTLSAGADGPAPRRWPLWAAGGGVLAAAMAAVILLWPSGPPAAALAVSLPEAPRVAPRVESTDVFLRLRSDPSGAEVYDPGPPRRLIGLTPLTLQRPRTTQTWRLKIRHPGYRERSVSVSLDRSRILFYALTRDPSARRVAEEPPGRRAATVEPRRRARRKRVERRKVRKRRVAPRQAPPARRDRDSTVNPFE